MSKPFKIVDSFLFSEDYEKELMLLKFQLEDDGIDEWIILENEYSLQGEYKGLNSRAIIEGDERFSKFKNKINIIEGSFKNVQFPRHEQHDEFSFKAEHLQRDLAQEYFIKNYSSEDWIIVSDVDEMVDFADPRRKRELLEHLSNNENGLILMPTKRYWYDFDNEYRPLIGNVICTKSYLEKNSKKLSEVRYRNRRLLKNGWRNIVAFEYSNCFPKDFILRKFYTSTHSGYTPDDLIRALKCNHRTINEKISGFRMRRGKKFFFQTIFLDSSNSPKTIRENLEKFKTNLIDQNYEKNRREEYPELFTIGYFIKTYSTDAKIFLKKRFKYLFRMLGIEKFIYRNSNA